MQIHRAQIHRAQVRRAQVEHWDFPRGAASSLLMVGYAEQAGLPPGTILEGSGLTLDVLHDPNLQVQARQELAIVSNLVAALGDRPGLGIDVGSRYRIATFGIFGYACITSPTLREAIDVALRYYALSFGFCIPSVSLGQGTVELTLEEPALPAPVARFLLERDLASIRTWMTDLVGDTIPLSHLDFTFADPGGFDYEAALGFAPAFGRPSNRSAFSAALLDQPLPQANELTVAQCEESCRAMLTDRLRRSGIAHEVRECLVSAAGPPPAIEYVASTLAMSERTLRRRLTQSGTSYRALLGEVRLTLAEQMLATGALSVEDVAIRLGYAEASSFIAAFHRWTGTTPARWQRQR